MAKCNLCGKQMPCGCEERGKQKSQSKKSQEKK